MRRTPEPGDLVLVDGVIEEIERVDDVTLRVWTHTRTIHFEDLTPPAAPDPGDIEAVEMFLQVDFQGTPSPDYWNQTDRCESTKCPCRSCYRTTVMIGDRPISTHHFTDSACRCEPKECPCLH